MASTAEAAVGSCTYILTCRLFRDSIQILLSFRPLTSRICASWSVGSAETPSKENYGSDKRPDPTDLHYNGQVYIPNMVQLKGYFDGFIKYL